MPESRFFKIYWSFFCSFACKSVICKRRIYPQIIWIILNLNKTIFFTLLRAPGPLGLPSWSAPVCQVLTRFIIWTIQTWLTLLISIVLILVNLSLHLEQKFGVSLNLQCLTFSFLFVSFWFMFYILCLCFVYYQLVICE